MREDLIPRIIHRPACPFSRRLRAYTEEKGIDARLERWDKERHPGDLAKHGFRPRVPVFIRADGLVLPESFVIMEYLEETHPKPALMPSDPECRARTRLLYALDEPLHHAVDALPHDLEAASTSFLDVLRGADPLLSKDGPHAIGTRFTMADLSVPMLVLRAVELGLDPARLPVRIRFWVQTVLDRPAIRRLFPDLSLRSSQIPAAS